MNKTTKANLAVVSVLAALSGAVYYSGCKERNKKDPFDAIIPKSKIEEVLKKECNEETIGCWPHLIFCESHGGRDFAYIHRQGYWGKYDLGNVKDREKEFARCKQKLDRTKK